MNKAWKRILAGVLSGVIAFNCMDISGFGAGSNIEGAGSVNTETGTEHENVSGAETGMETGAQGENVPGAETGTETDAQGENVPGAEVGTETGAQGESVPDTETGTEISAEGENVPGTEEGDGNGADAAEADPADVQGVSVEANTYGAPSAAASQNIPQNVADVQQGKVYYVRTYDDVLALQELSYQSSLEGCVFEFAKLNNSVNVWDMTNIGFTGLGNETYPFKGTIQEYFDSGVVFTMSRPMFNYLGTGAVIINFAFNLKNCTSGMADYFVIDSDTSGISCTNVSLTGTVVNASGAAGALYGKVTNKSAQPYEIPVNGQGLDVTGVTSVSGQIAGGYIGEVEGNVRIRITNGTNVAASVSSSGTAAGGMIGCMREGSTLQITDAAVTVSNTVSGKGSTGGIVGICEKASIVTGDYKITRGGTTMAAGNAGGFVGLISDGQVQISNFQLRGAVRADDNNAATENYAGGVVGRYDGTLDTTSLTVSRVGIDSGVMVGAGRDTEKRSSVQAAGYSAVGGVAGYINGSHVTVSDIRSDDTEYPFLPELRYHGYTFDKTNRSSSITGGIAGRIRGQEVELYNIQVAFTSGNGIAGYAVGDIAGYVEPQSKLRMTDITVSGNYVRAYSSSDLYSAYNGGLLGYVDRGSIVALCGTVDVSGITHELANTGLYGNQRGYIAGAQVESILYLEEGAVYKRNAVADNPDHAVWTEDYYNLSKGAVIDDVSSVSGGGIYRNIKDPQGNPVIVYDNPYGTEVTGALTYAGGKYQLNSDADALRLALALNTFDASAAGHPLRFGASCFQGGATGDSLLAADYEVTADLDFSATGIYTLSRNDSLDAPFTGTMTGVVKNGKNPSIRLHMISKQKYAGLFPKVKDAAFSNLDITGQLYFAQDAAAGIAPYGEGSLTVDHVNTSVAIRTYSYIPVYNQYSINYYGGLIGLQDVSGGGTVTISDSTIAPVVDNVRVMQIVGGAIGRIKTAETPLTEAAADTVIVERVTVSGSIEDSANFMKNYGYLGHNRVAGLIADVGYNYTNFQNDNADVGGTIKDATHAKLRLTDVSVSGAKIDAAPVNEKRSNVRATGGLLGYSWRNVDVQVNAAANSEALKVTDSTINSAGHVGGLVTTLAGRMTFNGKIHMDGLAMSSKSSENFCGFLVGDGRAAIITLTAADYILENSSASGYDKFDEIVGVNLPLSNSWVNVNKQGLTGGYTSCGIVNILKPEFSDMTADTYASYQSQVVTGTNPYTRYHYNLFTDAYDGEHVAVSGKTAVINSPEKLMLLSLAKGTNGNLKRFLLPYFGGADYSSVNTWNLSGTMDMNGYSYYPINAGGNYAGDGSAVIVLYGEDIENRENVVASGKKPSDSYRQHHRMHASVFYNASNIHVNNLTLRGTAADWGNHSAALVSGTIAGNCEFMNITCDGIRLANYDANGTPAYRGLLLGNVVNNANVKLDGITTTGNYTAGVHAAAALVSRVGDSNTNNVKIHFEHMKVEDAKETLFRYASLIYAYDFVDNANNNNSFGLYIFSKADDTAGNVTYGEEMELGVHYSDQNRDTHLEDMITNAVNGIYNPYVYTVKNIFVNPRNGNLTVGCGTYEDPYVISDSRQLFNLYLYLTGNTSYNELFVMDGTTATAWLVNPVAGGAADGRCADPAAHTAIQYGQPGFPTRDELRTAYYLITADLDLSEIKDLNDAVINSDFGGLGTTTYPFAGVLVGRKADGSKPAITLPNTREGRSQANYGLIQYMQGAVVKHLIIQDVHGADPAKTANICVSSAGAGVAAVSLGGDNIIDDVTVNMTLRLNQKAANGQGTNVTARTGGYVGTVQKGTVLVRNMAHEDLENYHAAYYSGGTYENLTNSVWQSYQSTYKDNCRMIGWVLDGAVLYEDTATDFLPGKATLEASDFGFSVAGLPGEDAILLSYSFPIINEDHLNAGNGAADNNGRIAVAGDSSSGFTLTIHDSEQLEVAALALNSYSFGIYDSGALNTNHNSGYDHTAICRKAEYSDLGWKQKGDAAPGSGDFALAIGNDDNNGHYPYLYYRYMDFSGVTGGYEATQVTKTVTVNNQPVERRISLLNWSNGDNTVYGGVSSGDVTTTWQLKGDVSYDLTAYGGYGRSFRGIGALYGSTDYPYAQFRANFNGNGAEVTFAMERDWDSVSVAGMFNSLTSYRPATAADPQGGFTIENISFRNCTIRNDSATATSNGLLAGHVKGIWRFSNISAAGDAHSVYDAATGQVEKAAGAADDSPETTLDKYTATVYSGSSTGSYTGGLVGRVTYYTNNSAYSNIQQIHFTDCSVTQAYVQGYGSVGGLLGAVEGNNGNQNSYFGTVDFTGCSVSDSTVWSFKGANVGGFVGRAGYAYNYDSSNYGHAIGTFRIADSALSDVSVQTSVNNATYSAGGLVGQLAVWNTTETELLSGITADGLTVISKGTNNAYYGVGGLVGAMWKDNRLITDCTVKNAWIGYNKAVPLTNNVQRLASGGICGSMIWGKADLKNITVQNAHIGSYHNAAGGMLGVCWADPLHVSAEAGKRNLIQNVDVTSYLQSVGGVAAISCNINNVISNGWSIADVTVENSRIRNENAALSSASDANYSAGGILGRIAANTDIRNVQLSDITVGDKTDIAGSYAGGLAGYMRGGNTSVTLSGAIHIGCRESSGSVQQDTDYSNIYGTLNAGGLYGYNEIGKAEKSTADVQVQKTRIGAYSFTGGTQAAAGAIAGHRKLGGSNNTNECIYDHAVIRDNVIVANYRDKNNLDIRAGGLYGMVSSSNTSSARICFYNPKLTDNSIGYADSVTSLDTLKALGDYTSDSVKLLSGKNTAVHWKDIPLLSEANVGVYSLRVGTFVGSWADGKRLYILRPEVSYQTGFTGSRPVIDVGNNNTAGVTGYKQYYGYDYPYGYRRYCNIVYFEPDAADANSDAAADYLDAALIAAGNNEDEYLFSSMDSIITKYNGGSNAGETFLNAYKLNVPMDEEHSLLDYYNSCRKDDSGNPRDLNGVPVVYADGGTAQAILDSMAGILTNAGGISANPSDAAMTGLLSVSVSKAKITSDGKIVADSGRVSQSITATNNIIKYQNLTYDEYNEAENSYTISLVKYRYGWTGADGTARYETIYIPVFVVERIAFYSTLSVMEGEQYSNDRAHDSSVSYMDDVTVAHDSTYTLFVEMAYGAGRHKDSYQSFTVARELNFQKSVGIDASGKYIWGAATIPKGMKMTMVDVETGKAYYYTEEGNNTSRLDFTRFKDADGNPYTNREIGSITNTTDKYQYGDDTSTLGYEFGLEQFYIYVDPSDVKDMENNIFKISVSTDETDDKTLNFLDRKESSGVQVTWMPGLSISFGNKDREGGTYIDGNINKEKPIEIDGQIQITADQTYWDEKAEDSSSFIDSENNHKYLDVAVYLINQKTGEYVNLPEGTNVIVDNGKPHATVSQYVTYAYKDWENVFPIGVVSKNSTDRETIVGPDGTTVKNYFHMTLDFSLANIDDYVGESYNILLELRRTSDPDYPLGDSRVDEYTNMVTGVGDKDMAVALEVEDILDLGINTYQQTQTSYEIPFETKLDFNNAIVNEADLMTCAERNYLVTYRLKKKVKSGSGYEYVTVKDSGGGSDPSGLHLGDELKLVAPSEQDGSTVYEELPMTTYNGEAVYQLQKKFSASELRAGMDGMKYTVGWDAVLQADTAGIADEDLSNYMVEVTVLPYDTAEIPENDRLATLVDYYIFTIGKIKTDM